MISVSPDLIRNVGLFSHGGAGKTTLAEAMLFAAGVVSRAGRVDDGTTVSDYEPEEHKRRISVNLAVLPLVWRNCKINLLDAPGFLDFAGETREAIRACDAALVLVDAVAGVEVGTDLIWKQLDVAEIPRAVVISKADRENSDYGRVLESLRARFGAKVVPLHVPVVGPNGLEGIVDLVEMEARLGPTMTAGAIPAAMLARCDQYREQLVEAVAETDDDLIVKYLDGETLTREEITGALARAAASGKIIPVLAASGLLGRGVPAVLDAVVDLLPSPGGRPSVRALDIAANREVVCNPASDGPLCALVFKTIADPFVGKLTYFRVFSGTVRSDSHVWNVTRGRDERLGTLYLVRGKTQEPAVVVGPGDIGAVAKLQETATGDTLGSREHQSRLPAIEFPKPVYSVAVDPKSKADLDKLGNALHRIVEDDQTTTVRRDPETGETVLSGLGEQHVDVTIERMRRKFGVEVEIREPRVPYRETIVHATQSEYKHKKQTGGHGQYGHVSIEIEPLPRGTGCEFTEHVVGGAVPRNFIPAVEKGFREAIPEGILAGYPIVDVRVTLLDGSYHPVDSSEMAFKLATSQAFKKGCEEAHPILLEPVMDFFITVPEQFVGDAMSDLNGKRARVQGLDPDGDVTTIRAQAPQSEMQRYSTDLRSITQGRGTYTAEFSHYEEVPAHVAQQVIADHKKAHAAAH
ncbi:MAG: elongation factor G [Chloroflexota bacterium]|nr:MAG: elongation factor G [Chloroflexota bacterium]